MRESDLLARITIDPEQCLARPCIRGMRIRVIDVLELLAAGETREEIRTSSPMTSLPVFSTRPVNSITPSFPVVAA